MKTDKSTLLVRLVLLWLAIWPIVMAGLVAIGWAAPHLSFVARTFVLTGIMVPIITLIVGPLVGRVVARYELVRARR